MKWTIRRKFFVGFFILFSIAALVFNYFLSNFIQNQAQTTIENDVVKLQHISKEYFKQFKQLHKDETELFTVFGQELTQKLSELYGHSIALYTPDGIFITEAIPIQSPLLMSQKKHEQNVNENSSKELKLAFDNKASYTVTHLSNGYIVTFAYPVFLYDEFYGVVRFTADYTNLFSHNEQLLTHFRILTMSLLFGVFCIAVLLTQQIIKPLRQLTNATKQLANRMFDPLSIKTSTDEVGELAAQFSTMQEQINQYISRIEQEKEKVLQLEKDRTILFQNVTHELKTPLTAISGYAQIIGEDNFDDSLFLQKASQKIYHESTRLNEMVNELLIFSKSQSSKRKPQTFDVTPIVKEVIEDIQFTSGQKIEFRGSTLYITAVREEVKRVLINVIQNAWKHGEDPVVIVERRVMVRNRCDELSSDIVAHVFEPFVHRKHKDSHGLGLFISKQLTEANGGNITFSYENQIVTVEIDFGHNLATTV